MTIEEKRRELFEADALRAAPGSAGCMHKTSRGSYHNPYMQARWDGFNAALDAVEIELPAFDDWPSSMANDMNRDCRAAIESTGLGLKVKP